VGLGGSHVLVVDNHVVIREALAAILEDEGYAVEVAANGAEALAMLRAGSRPKLVLTDLMMPVLDGWQFAKTVAADPALAGVPICVMTASGRMAPPPAQAMEVLYKPLDMDCLLATVERYCGPRRQDQRTQGPSRP
jgi:CheY-like chemotaxis protein